MYRQTHIETDIHTNTLKKNKFTVTNTQKHKKTDRLYRHAYTDTQ